ncbi:hypothetical protein BESB_002900 [Besnoitia besnoiti]|uniref:Protein FAM33A n=1 Tax=Besnoitia besnoiti TaxID=94643 RepID=A0A2A9MJ60_BESBE|nr:hypothetical protein BESB_002900 [Besnoitia besnoiti]PFH37949.1 hypothetical protein BESB_002900 [Besnoitia besnoiti]
MGEKMPGGACDYVQIDRPCLRALGRYKCSAGILPWVPAKLVSCKILHTVRLGLEHPQLICSRLSKYHSGQFDLRVGALLRCWHLCLERGAARTVFAAPTASGLTLRLAEHGATTIMVVPGSSVPSKSTRVRQNLLPNGGRHSPTARQVEQRLDQEFAHIYGPERHPRHLLQRLAKVQKNIQLLSEQFQLIFTAKSQLADTLRQQLRSYELLATLQEAAGGEAPAQDVRCEQIYQEGEELLRRWMNTDQRAMQFPEFAADEQGAEGKAATAAAPGPAGTPDAAVDGIWARTQDHVSRRNLSSTPGEVNSAVAGAAEAFPAGLPATVLGRPEPAPEAAAPGSRDSGNSAGEKALSEQQTSGASEETRTEDCVCGFLPLSAPVFEQVPALTRRRARLQDVNALFHCLFHMRYEKGREGASTTVKELNKMNFTVVGQTGEAKLSTLRYLRLIEVNGRTGEIRLLAPPRKTRAAAGGRRGALRGSRHAGTAVRASSPSSSVISRRPPPSRLGAVSRARSGSWQEASGGLAAKRGGALASAGSRAPTARRPDGTQSRTSLLRR